VVNIGDVALSLDSGRYSTFTHASMPRFYILESRVRTSLHPAALHTTLAKGQEIDLPCQSPAVYVYSGH
jgi:hypothetical protein